LKISQDPEVRAMRRVATALEGLDPQAAHRVCSWAIQRKNDELEAKQQAAREAAMQQQAQKQDA